jgi:hypothetical protein
VLQLTCSDIWKKIDMIHAMQRSLVSLLVLSLLVTAPLAPVQAAIIGTDEALSRAVEAQTREALEGRINAVLLRDDVRAQLTAMGVDPAQAAERVQSLTFSELQRLDGQLGQLPAGSGLLGVIGVVMVVLLILELVGVVDIFKNF